MGLVFKINFVHPFELNDYSAIDFDGNIKAHANDDDLFRSFRKGGMHS